MAPKQKVAKREAKAHRLPKKGKSHASSARKTKPTPKAVPAVPRTSTPPKPKEQVIIAAAKGRPMLTWVGKRPLRSVTPFPAQHIESYTAPNASKALTQTPVIWKDWPSHYPQGGLLFHGDNKEVLAHLLANGFRGKVQLIYIDPPFDSGADYVRKVNLRGANGTAQFEGEQYSLGEQIQYTDIWANDNYLQFMYERLLLLKELLSESGSIFLHCDDQKNYLLRAVLDEIFGSQNFRNEIIWKRSTSTGLATKRCGTLHDIIYWYSKSETYDYFMQFHQHDDEYLKRVRKDEKGRDYIPIPTGNPGPRPNLYYEYKGYWPHPNGYKWTREKMEQYDREGLLLFPEDKSGRIQFKQYLDKIEGVKLQDLWTDVYSVNPVAAERLGYPTQKPESLLSRIVNMVTRGGDIVLDSFVGSGTTVAVAQNLGRRWIGCDINTGAIQTTAKRLQAIIQEQIDDEKHASPHTASLPGMEAHSKDEAPKPAQLGLTTWRVNNYDLAIQHNEAVNLACEHIGVTRTLSDSFFDGTLGQKLVKIIPFGHPLSLTDLEDVRAKIESRPNDSRDVVVVCLGKELGVDAWLADWNRIRKQGNTPNKIEVIELRTDPKYGKFFAHKPAQARVKMSRSDGKLTIDVQDFISPTILERLQEQAGPLLAPKITDWRAMVDSVMIDPAYDGKVFNIAFADVPERKQDLVQGRYELPAPKGKTVVAVKVTDMLGEEVLVQQEV
jgi:DNA modification methylase